MFVQQFVFTFISDQPDLSKIKAIQWGNNHEKEGLKTLSDNLKKEIKACGVFLSSSGVLGASPDGLIDEDYVVEIKCPYKFREVLLAEELKKDKSYIFYYDDNSKLRLNAKHPYYDQVQGQLYLTKRNFCYLCVWTPKQAIYALISKDKSWEQNLRKMEKFYFDHFISFLTRK